MTHIICRQVIIKNKLGLHARAATKLVQLNQEFTSHVILKQGEKTASADSVLGLLLLESAKGKTIDIEIEGEDAEDAAEAFVALFERRFDEEE
ncbi:HPr family phosphocarrier protein [Algicola sagamiensis]|uniref:HPr family phosphocarrier protein n=1 Tax=Algicola sagamiensis TaxID=163869 RepID=UPI000371B862|nr:HPr family phosphocarrier protein [Algicola sagamiensis]